MIDHIEFGALPQIEHASVNLVLDNEAMYKFEVVGKK
jgi:hypothetical protein